MKLDLLSILLEEIYRNVLEQSTYQYLLSFFIACFITVTSIPVIINISDLLNLREKPIFRSAHLEATPKFGGIGIFAAIIVGHLIWPHTEDLKDTYLTNLAIVSMTILFFLGLKDDILILDPSKKLYFQILASTILIVLGDLKINHLYDIWGWEWLPDYVSIPITIFVFIALINAINLIDGIDGLAAGIGLIAGMTFGIWFGLHGHTAMASLAVSMSGALLGYLRFNFSRTSKIFMGDTGSLIIGFMLAFFAIKFIKLNIPGSATDSVFNAPIVAIVILIVPIFDSLRMFLVRILNRKSPFKADRNHLHHVLLDNGLDHFGASLVLWSVTVVNIVLFFSYHGDMNNTKSVIVLFCLFLVYLLTAYLLKMRVRLLRKKEIMRELPVVIDQNRMSMVRRFLRNL